MTSGIIIPVSDPQLPSASEETAPPAVFISIVWLDRDVVPFSVGPSCAMSASTSTPPIPPRVAAKPPVKPRVSSPPAHVATFSSSSPSPAAAPLGLDHDRFGSCLQTCYDAINKRHEEELRALESLRVHIFNRAKADREYAESLARINQRATRGVANITQQSAIVQVRRLPASPMIS